MLHKLTYIKNVNQIRTSRENEMYTHIERETNDSTDKRAQSIKPLDLL